MYYIIYSSYASIEFNDSNLKDLLAHAREKNGRLGITGMLFYFSDKFVQLIEGEEEAVKTLAREIANDTRHKFFVILKEGPIQDRFYADWSMGFRSINPAEFTDVANFKELNGSTGLNTSVFLRLFNILA